MPGLRLPLVAATAAAGILMLPALALAAPAGAAAAPSAVTQVKGLSSLGSVACPTATACVAVGIGSGNALPGRSAVITAATGAVKAWSGKINDEPMNAIACPSKTRCLAVADDAVATVKVATGGMKVTAKPAEPTGGIVAMDAIACAGGSNCYAVGFEGPFNASQALLVHLSGSGKLLSQTTDAGTGSGAIACPSKTVCLLSDYVAGVSYIQVLSNGAFGASNPLPTGTYVEAIRCKSGACYALAGNDSSSPSATDELFPLNATTGAVGSVISLNGFDGYGFTCTSASTCLVSGASGSGASAVSGVLTVSHGTAGTLVSIPGASLSFAGIACATATNCYLTGSSSKGAVVDQYIP